MKLYIKYLIILSILFINSKLIESSNEDEKYIYEKRWGDPAFCYKKITINKTDNTFVYEEGCEVMSKYSKGRVVQKENKLIFTSDEIKTKILSITQFSDSSLEKGRLKVIVLEKTGLPLIFESIYIDYNYNNPYQLNENGIAVIPFDSTNHVITIGQLEGINVDFGTNNSIKIILHDIDFFKIDFKKTFMIGKDFIYNEIDTLYLISTASESF